MLLRLDQSVQELSAISSQSCQASDCHCRKMLHRLDQICELQWQSEERQIWLPMAGGSCTCWSNLQYIGRIYYFRRYFNISRPNFGAIMPRALPMCFSKYSVLFNVLSKRLHWISHLFLSTCLFKPSALLKTARQFSHLNSSLTHFAMWLFLLLYGILFSQWLHVTSLCVFSFMPPMHFFSHFSQVRTRSSCFAWICILRCFSKGASMRQMAQEDRWTDGWMRTSVCGTGRSKSAAYVCPNLPRKMRH